MSEKTKMSSLTEPSYIQTNYNTEIITLEEPEEIYSVGRGGKK